MSNDVALVIDLDGSLVRTDLLIESFFSATTKGLTKLRPAFAAFGQGKAQLKAVLAKLGPVDYQLLPYNEGVLSLIRDARRQGRPVYLATASDEYHANGIAQHLGLFDGVIASDGVTNVSGEAKAHRLVEAFGSKGFDYVGDGDVDRAVWRHARKALIVGNSDALARQVETTGIPVERINTARPSLRVWLKALRVHQYVKNGLVFVPLFTAHTYSLHFLLNACLAFVAFSLCASSVYILNDLVDLDADRRHPTKRERPFASGAIPLVHGVAAVPLLLLLAAFCAIAVSLPFAGTLTVYFSLTSAYSFSLKRKLMVDVVVLASLYTIRVIAGAVALPVPPSEWLLAFSMFIFTCLALVKRYAELAMRIDKELPDPSNRNYRLVDLPIVGALAAASGFNAVTIFALYVSSPAVQDVYKHPALFWLICPILLYWLGRVVVLVHRRVIEDDPILFALRDRNSYLAGIAMIIVVLLAN